MNKRQFVELLQANFKRLGWRSVPGSAEGAMLHLFRERPKSMFLSLVVEASTLYEDSVSASFYLAPHLAWGLTGPDSPSEAFQRVSALLTGMDELWTGYGSETVEALVRSVREAEPIFLMNEIRLAQLIGDSETSRVFAARLRAVIDGVLAMGPTGDEKKPSSRWFESATQVLGRTMKRPDRREVQFLGTNAWRVWTVAGDPSQDEPWK